MYELKTNTAVRIAVGPLVDPTDGKTAETSLTVTDLSVQIYQIKTDGNAVVRTQFAPTASGGNNDMVHVTDDTTGMYDLELTAAQLNFLGNARIAFYDVDGFLVHWIDIHVVSANYWDWKYGTGNVNSDVVAISGDTTAADNCELMFDGTGYAGGTTKLGVDVIAVSGDTDAADNLEKACDGTTYNIGGGAVVAASVTGAVGSVANGGIAAASFAAGAIDAAAIADDAVDAASIKTDAVTKLQNGLATSTALSTVDTVVDAIKLVTDALATTIEVDGAVCRFTENALEEAPTGGGGGITVEDILTGTIEGSIDLRESLMLLLAFIAGRATGGGTSTIAFRNQANTLNRISYTVDEDGNRTAVTVNLA